MNKFSQAVETFVKSISRRDLFHDAAVIGWLYTHLIDKDFIEPGLTRNATATGANAAEVTAGQPYRNTEEFLQQATQ